MLEACRVNGITVIEGRFKNKTFRCNFCGSSSNRHEEKETDVNVALTAYRVAGKVDRVWIVSGDTDMIPAISAIQEDFGNDRVGVIFPFNRFTDHMKCAAINTRKTKADSLPNFILPEKIAKKDGTEIICPEKWR